MVREGAHAPSLPNLERIGMASHRLQIRPLNFAEFLELPPLEDYVKQEKNMNERSFSNISTWASGVYLYLEVQLKKTNI